MYMHALVKLCFKKKKKLINETPHPSSVYIKPVRPIPG